MRVDGNQFARRLNVDIDAVAARIVLRIPNVAAKLNRRDLFVRRRIDHGVGVAVLTGDVQLAIIRIVRHTIRVRAAVDASDDLEGVRVNDRHLIASRRGRVDSSELGDGKDTWLIRTFIDPQATFRWLSDVRDCPLDALGFDFDGATFTHVGDAVTFEVLMQSFALDDDRGLELLGEMVRSLDIASAPRSAEAVGFEAILTGAREQCATDDELLDAIAGPLAFLHAAFARRANGAVRGDPDDTRIGEQP